MYMDEEYLDQQRRLNESNFKESGCVRGLVIAGLVAVMFVMIIILIAG